MNDILMFLKQKFLIIFIFAFTNLSIAQSKVDYDIVESITSKNSLDDMAKEVNRVYGLADETVKSDSGEHYSQSYYINKKTKSERILLTFDQRNKIVQFVLVFPSENEIDVRKILNQRFLKIDSGDGWLNKRGELGLEINNQGLASMLIIYSVL